MLPSRLQTYLNSSEQGKVHINGLFAFLSTVVNSVAVAVTTMILARHLGVVGYGLYAVVLAMVNIAVPFVDWGMALTLVREITNRREHRSEFLGEVAVFRLCLAVLVLCVLAAVTFFKFDDWQTRTCILLYGVELLVLHQVVILPVRSAILADEKMKWDLVIALMVQGLRISAIVFSVIADFSIVGVFSMLVAGDAVAATLVFTVFKKTYASFAFPGNLAGVKELISSSWPLAVTLLLNTAYLQVDVLVLEHFTNEIEVGRFSAPYSLIVAIFAFLVPFIRVYLPALSRLAHEPLELQTARIENVASAYMLLATAMSIVLMVSAPLLVLIALGKEFQASILVVVICSPLIVFRGIDAIGTLTLAAFRRPGAMIVSASLAFVVNLGMDLWLVPKMGFMGAAVGTLVADGVIFIAILIILRVVLGLRMRLWRVFLPLLAGVVLVLLWYAGLNSWAVIPLTFAVVAACGVVTMRAKRI